MLHRIEIENYGSIREKQVIDLTLPATTPEMDRFVPSYASPEIRLPKVVAFFGPNAAGKTTVLRAIGSTIDFAVSSFNLTPDAPIPYFTPFRSEAWWNRPTRIAIDFDGIFIAETHRLFRYAVEIRHSHQPGQRDDARVQAETLLVRDGRRFRALFRHDEQGIRCARELRLPPSDSRLKAVRDNASFISTLAHLNHDLIRPAWEDVAATQRNVRCFTLANPDMRVALDYLRKNPEALAELRIQISRFDLGIRDLQIREIPSGPFAGPYAVFSHEGLSGPVFDMEESNGTRHFLAMFPMLWFTLKSGRPALVDEFDVNLHPLLVPEILNWFHDPELNPGKAQLFLVAHNAAIMDHLEKEEVFLVEKSRDGASTIIPVRDFKGLRREPSLQRKYLGGTLGAVPNIG